MVCIHGDESLYIASIVLLNYVGVGVSLRLGGGAGGWGAASVLGERRGKRRGERKTGRGEARVPPVFSAR